MKFSTAFLLIASATHIHAAPADADTQAQATPSVQDSEHFDELFRHAGGAMNPLIAMQKTFRRLGSGALAVEGIGEVYVGSRLIMHGLKLAARSHLKVKTGSKWGPEYDEKVSLVKLLEEHAPRTAFMGKEAARDVMAILKEVFAYRPKPRSPYMPRYEYGRTKNGSTVDVAVDGIVQEYQRSMSKAFGQFPGRDELGEMLNNPVTAMPDITTKAATESMLAGFALAGGILSTEMNSFMSVLNMLSEQPGMDAFKAVSGSVKTDPLKAMGLPPTLRVIENSRDIDANRRDIIQEVEKYWKQFTYQLKNIAKSSKEAFCGNSGSMRGWPRGWPAPGPRGWPAAPGSWAGRPWSMPGPSYGAPGPASLPSELSGLLSALERPKSPNATAPSDLVRRQLLAGPPKSQNATAPAAPLNGRALQAEILPMWQQVQRRFREYGHDATTFVCKGSPSMSFSLPLTLPASVPGVTLAERDRQGWTELVGMWRQFDTKLGQAGPNARSQICGAAGAAASAVAGAQQPRLVKRDAGQDPQNPLQQPPPQTQLQQPPPQNPA